MEHSYELSPDSLYKCGSGKYVAIGRSVQNSHKFKVLAGSKARIKEIKGQCGIYSARRRVLVEKGILKDYGDCLKFTKDVIFTHPSEAATIVLGKKCGGDLAWKEI